MEDGGWRMEDGGGRWRMEDGNAHTAITTFHGYGPFSHHAPLLLHDFYLLLDILKDVLPKESLVVSLLTSLCLTTLTSLPLSQSAPCSFLTNRSNCPAAGVRRLSARGSAETTTFSTTSFWSCRVDFIYFALKIQLLWGAQAFQMWASCPMVLLQLI